MATAKPPTLEVAGLTTRFDTRRGPVHAVNGVSFQIEPGQSVGIVGESGSGKSAMVRSITRLIRPPGRIVGGTVHLLGRELLTLREHELRHLRGLEVGFVGQNPFGSLNPILRIGDQFRNMARAHRRREAATKEFAIERLRAVGIGPAERVWHGYAHELSGGMSQRVVLAIATSLDPALVIADEPTTALDVTVQRQILDLIRSLTSDAGRSLLLVTHDLAVVSQYCDWVITMYAGKVVEQGPIRRVFAQPAHPYTRALYQAVPGAGGELVGFAASAPNLRDDPRGCPYRSRCPYAFDRCVVEAPTPRPVPSGGEVACHLAEG